MFVLFVFVTVREFTTHALLCDKCHCYTVAIYYYYWLLFRTINRVYQFMCSTIKRGKQPCLWYSYCWFPINEMLWYAAILLPGIVLRRVNQNQVWVNTAYFIEANILWSTLCNAGISQNILKLFKFFSQRNRYSS